MITKKKFIEILNILQDTDNICTEVNQIFKECRDNKISDGMNAASLMICHEDIVVELLQNIFNDTDTISYWLYELDYGRKYRDGCLREADGTTVDISTPEKLYDYLTKTQNKEE